MFIIFIRSINILLIKNKGVLDDVRYYYSKDSGSKAEAI